LAIDGDEWSALCLTWGKDPSTHSVGGWVGPKSVWTWWWRERIPAPASNWIPVIWTLKY